SASEIGTVESIFLPFIHRYSSLSWLCRRDIELSVNSPIDSQAMLLRVWYQAECFSEQNRRKFNQVIKKPLELDMNPFKNWNERWFSRQQLDYLFYWREAAYEIEDHQQREVFWGAVYAIMSYWLGHRQVNVNPVMQPDEIMHHILMMHKETAKTHEGMVKISSSSFEDLEPPVAALTVFPLIFPDDEDEETQLQAIYQAWFHGHSDVEQARRDIRNQLRRYHFSLEKKTDFSEYLRLARDSQIVAVCWSGEELPPRIHEQEIIEPFRREFSGRFSRSRFSIKAVDRQKDSYDYLLLFFN
ncbi:MAG: hypothetical protein AB1403_13675, partial [Candidatus Riflebacteria bacterium]